MGTRAILIIDNEAKTPNVFYAQYASPAFKIPALTLWIVAAALECRERSAEDYAAFAEADTADHFKERLGALTLKKACREWANSDIEYLYYVGPESPASWQATSSYPARKSALGVSTTRRTSPGRGICTPGCMARQSIT